MQSAVNVKRLKAWTDWKQEEKKNWQEISQKITNIAMETWKSSSNTDDCVPGERSG